MDILNWSLMVTDSELAKFPYLCFIPGSIIDPRNRFILPFCLLQFICLICFPRSRDPDISWRLQSATETQMK